MYYNHETVMKCFSRGLCCLIRIAFQFKTYFYGCIFVELRKCLLSFSACVWWLWGMMLDLYYCFSALQAFVIDVITS